MAEKPAKIEPLLGPKDFYLNSSLYTPYQFDDFQIHEVMNIISFKGPLDCYCIKCQQQSIFQTMESSGGGAGLGCSPSITGFFVKLEEHWFRTTPAPKSDEIFIRRFHCTRTYDHELIFVLRHTGQMIEKIGQSPSLADLVTAEIRKYRKLLGIDAHREFSKAIGLSSHGIGIGAFVYLRRIIENLIEEAHQVAKTSEGWDESVYTDRRTVERMHLLKGFLPPFLVENTFLYAILSKGLHELSENECLEAFSLMRISIELILDQKLEKQEREAKIARAKQEIADLHRRTTRHSKDSTLSPIK